MKMYIEFDNYISKLQVDFIHMKLCLYIIEGDNYDNRYIMLAHLFSDFSLCYPEIIEVAEKLRDNNFMNTNSLERILRYFNIINDINNYNKFTYYLAKYMDIYKRFDL